VKVTFRVRNYQAKFYQALVNRTHDRLIAVWHRRAGKDEICLHALQTLALKEPGTYWICFPEQAQARKALWNGINHITGNRRILDAIPSQIIGRMQDADMYVELNQDYTAGNKASSIQLIGSDRYDSTVGSGPRGIIYSEWALSNPAAWAYHSPMIRESRGFAAFITTPRGNNHAKTMFDRAQGNDAWFSRLLTAEDTKALSADVLAEALEEYQDLHGVDFGRALFEQEYLCSWSGSTVGAFWGDSMNRAEREGRIRPLEIDREHPVHTAWDLGKTANNPVWCFQVIAGKPRIVDFYQPDSDDLHDWVAWLHGQGYDGNFYLPHDVLVTEWGSKRTRLDVLKQHHNAVKRVERVSVADGLQAGRTTINEAVFHAADDERGKRMALGIEGLKNYRREWDDERKTFRENAFKDWSEHIGSAFRYLGLSWREVVPPRPKVLKPKELAYEVKPDGRVVGNMSVKEAVDAMVKRRRRDG